ncbi:MAG: sialate O-acetylesterase [Planctomycetota bacterium]|jgi:sialate O-acetylesterase
MIQRNTVSAFLVTFLLITVSAFSDEIKLPSIFSDNMVVQADKDIPVWGWAEPGAEIEVSFAGKNYSAAAAKDGKWRLKIKPVPAGGPFEMKVASPAKTVLIKNVLVGEVWFCSGQSNMQMALRKTEGGKTESITADDNKVRCFFVERRPAVEKKEDRKGKWVELSPKTAGNFSAVAYYFAKQLRRELKVPVGLIHSNWGGTAAESWISMEGFERNEVLQPRVPAVKANIKKAETLPRDVKLDDSTWMQKGYDDSGWEKITLPLYWDYRFYPVDYDGEIWARKKVTIPEDWKGKALTLSHKVDDFETSYINGVEVGKTTRHTLVVRKYKVPASLTGGTEITVAVKTNKFGWGGLCGRKEDMHLALESEPEKKVSLAGEWKFKASTLKFKNISARLETSLYNGMVHPFITYAMAGVIWYQGEANANFNTAVSYRKIFPALIRDWRKKWGQGDFPFYYVQLANFKTSLKDCWPLLRESQLKTLSVPNTGMAVTIDIGNPSDIHPANKKDVGERLSRWALAKTYGKDCEYSGPLYKEMAVAGNEITLSFTNTTGGLSAKGGELAGFEIAGHDKKYYPAKAVIKGNTVVVSSEKVESPKAARYAWEDHPEGCNLYNGEGLPLLYGE